ncbi:SUKH-4 family immunity protein [Streptomyces sp. 7R007]
MAALEMVEIPHELTPGRIGVRVPAEPVFGVYRPVGTFKKVAIAGRDLIEFGLTGAFGVLLLDLSSGVVLERVNGESDLSVVNTSIDTFNRCLCVFYSKFPFPKIEDDDESDERDNRVAREVEEEVRRIDPEAYEENSFWYEVRWSVAIGDFSD